MVTFRSENSHDPVLRVDPYPILQEVFDHESDGGCSKQDHNEVSEACTQQAAIAAVSK